MLTLLLAVKLVVFEPTNALEPAERNFFDHRRLGAVVRAFARAQAGITVVEVSAPQPCNHECRAKVLGEAGADFEVHSTLWRQSGRVQLHLQVLPPSGGSYGLAVGDSTAELERALPEVLKKLFAPLVAGARPVDRAATRRLADLVVGRWKCLSGGQESTMEARLDTDGRITSMVNSGSSTGKLWITTAGTYIVVHGTQAPVELPFRWIEGGTLVNGTSRSVRSGSTLVSSSPIELYGVTFESETRCELQ